MKSKKELFILRIGGSVLTDRNKSKPNINFANINILASEIKKAKKEKDFDLLIVHGMGAFGHPIAKKFNIHKKGISPKKIKGVALLADSLRKLNSIFVSFLISKGLNTINYPSNYAITDNRKIVYMPIETIKKYLQLGFIPILYALPVYDVSNSISILSADHLAPYLAKSLKPKLLISGVSIEGVYDYNPKKNSNAKLVKKITPLTFKKLIKEIGGTHYVDVTGGMVRKLTELLNVTDCGVKSRIINITRPNILSQTIIGNKNYGTLVTKD